MNPMTEVQNTPTETLLAHLENPPINNITRPVKKPTKRKGEAVNKTKNKNNNKTKNKTIVSKPKELKWGEIDTLSVECVTKRLNRISVCYPCGGHRICKRCLVDWKVKLPQTYSYPKDEGVDWFNRVMEKVEVEYSCKRNFGNNLGPDTCFAEGVGEFPCTVCLQFDDNGPSKPTWSYGEDLSFILNEHGVCPGCMVFEPEEICTVCRHDNRGCE